MRRLNVTIQVWKKRDLYLTSAPELDFISQGNTFDEAKRNLLEVIEIQFQEMAEIGTLEEYLSECCFIIEGDEILPQREIMGFEKSVVMVA